MLRTKDDQIFAENRQTLGPDQEGAETSGRLQKNSSTPGAILRKRALDFPHRHIDVNMPL